MKHTAHARAVLQHEGRGAEHAQGGGVAQLPAQRGAQPGVVLTVGGRRQLLEGVREEPSTPAVRATDDATLLEYGRSVCPAIEAGATFADFDFPGLDPYLDAPIVAGAAVGTYCPDLIEAAVGGDLDAVLDDYLEA